MEVEKVEKSPGKIGVIQKAKSEVTSEIKGKLKTKIRIALAGHPNSGKSTIFNALTGLRQYVGNWPGVTVEKKEGRFEYNGFDVEVVDLPGTYSLTAYSLDDYSLDERIARDFLLKEKVDAVVAVVDASNPARNLYIMSQLLELGLNVIIDLNMMDEAERKKITIDTQKMEKILGLKIVKTVGTKEKGIDELRKAIIESAMATKLVAQPIPQASFLADSGLTACFFKIDYGPDIEKEIKSICEFIDGKIPSAYPLRWFAVKLLEGDLEILDLAKSLPDGEKIGKMVEASVKKLEKHLGYDIETAIIERRYAFLEGLVKECVVKGPTVEERLSLSDKIDMVVTNRFVGVPVFLCLMWLVFQLVFKIGGFLSGWIDKFFTFLSAFSHEALVGVGAPFWLISLISDGAIPGVGSVIVFLPYISILFFSISILEESGYMSRAAFVMDRIMHAFGLHGKSSIPMVLGFGCNVPAIMATRTLESRKDRILTILILPLMSCSARLPIYTLFAAAFFPKNQGMVVFSLYLLGIILAIIMARIFKSLLFRHEVAPLIMELPPYRLPSIKGVLVHTWERSRLFLRKAGTIIFGGVVLIWLLGSIPWGVEYASEQSVIGRIGTFIAPVLKPAGFGFWQAAVGLIFGVIAKEMVVGAFGTLYGVSEGGLVNVIRSQFNMASAYAFMAISLIYIPC
ncbi:MAG: ferrous iron transport protein B, partial [Actinobacteria bacterium]|nr:ferrous iron transport protein B [Actinomycetota bacterium]